MSANIKNASVFYIPVDKINGYIAFLKIASCYEIICDLKNNKYAILAIS
jgi:hypothetical protein